MNLRITKKDCSHYSGRHCATCGCAYTQHDLHGGKCHAKFCAVGCTRFVLCIHPATRLENHICVCKWCRRIMEPQKESVITNDKEMDQHKENQM